MTTPARRTIDPTLMSALESVEYPDFIVEDLIENGWDDVTAALDSYRDSYPGPMSAQAMKTVLEAVLARRSTEPDGLSPDQDPEEDRDVPIGGPSFADPTSETPAPYTAADAAPVTAGSAPRDVEDEEETAMGRLPATAPPAAVATPPADEAAPRTPAALMTKVEDAVMAWTAGDATDEQAVDTVAALVADYRQ